MGVTGVRLVASRRRCRDFPFSKLLAMGCALVMSHWHGTKHPACNGLTVRLGWHDPMREPARFGLSASHAESWAAVSAREPSPYTARTGTPIGRRAADDVRVCTAVHRQSQRHGEPRGTARNPRFTPASPHRSRRAQAPPRHQKRYRQEHKRRLLRARGRRQNGPQRKRERKRGHVWRHGQHEPR